MNDTGSVIDWNVELRKISREYDGLPPETTPARVRAERVAELRAREREAALGALVATWARVLLVGSLAAALVWWPYGRDCGLPLAGFVGAASMLIVGGTWSAACAWRRRLAIPHVASIALLVAGLALVGAESVPRAGVGTLSWVDASGWRCTAGASAAAR